MRIAVKKRRIAPGDIIPLNQIDHLIYVVRGQRVMLDSDLARLYGVTTFNLNKAVGRNTIRFPDDFLFRLSKQEWDSLRFQIGILRKLKKHDQQINALFTAIRQLLAPPARPHKKIGF